MRSLLLLIGLVPLLVGAQSYAPVTAVAVASDGKAVYAGYSDGRLRAFDGVMRTQKWQVRTDAGIARLAVAPDGKTVAASFAIQGTWRNIRLYESATGKMLRSLGVGATVAMSKDGKWIAVGGPGGLVIVDAKTLQVAQRFESAGLVLNVAFDPSGERMAYTANGSIWLLSTKDWKGVGSVRMPTWESLQLGFASNGSLVATVPKTGQLFRWNLNSGEALPTLSSKFAQTVAASVAPDGSVAAFVGIENEVELFDLVSGERLSAPRLGGGYANSLGLSGPIAAIGTLDGQVRWASRPMAREIHPPVRIADAISSALIKRRADVMTATTVLGAPVRVIQVDLKRPNVKVGIEVAQGFPTGAEPFSSMVQRSGATVAITGTFFDTASLRPVGDIVQGGDVLYRGHMGTALALTADNEPFMRRVPFGRTQDWSGFDTVLSCGPALVLDGEVDVDATGEGFRDPSIFATTARVGVGFTADRRLLLVATGPLSFSGFARVMKELECTHAMNLDAGSSRALYYRGQTLIKPGRLLTNILYVRVR